MVSFPLIGDLLPARLSFLGRHFSSSMISALLREVSSLLLDEFRVDTLNGHDCLPLRFERENYLIDPWKVRSDIREDA